MRPALYHLRAFKLALAVARVLPRSLAQRVAQQVGRWVLARQPVVREALRDNLGTITGRTGAALDALCAANVENFTAMLADYFHCTAGGDVRALLEEWRGVEQLEAARALGRGVILVTAHLGNWELGGLLLAHRGLPMSVVTLEEPTAELTRWRDAFRLRAGIRTYAVGPGHNFAFVELIAALRRGEVVAMLVDRPYAGSGESVEFFGRRTKFSTAPALLWQHTGAAVVPAFVLRNETGRYTAFADAPLPLALHSESRVGLAANTQIVATHFENIIRQHPDQWFNYVPIWPAPPAADADVRERSGTKSG